MRQYRQGDLLIEEVKEIPKCKKIDNRILARGEASNHIHVLDKISKVDIFETGDSITSHYLKVWNKTELKHLKEGTEEQAEHDVVVLSKGNYQVIRQVEYNPYKKEIGRVQD